MGYMGCFAIARQSEAGQGGFGVVECCAVRIVDMRCGEMVARCFEAGGYGIMRIKNA